MALLESGASRVAEPDGAGGWRVNEWLKKAVLLYFRCNDMALVDAVYSGVPASMVGREQEIEVGPMSGKSNVVFWLERRGLQASEEIVDRIFARAKASSCVLTEEEIRRSL